VNQTILNHNDIVDLAAALAESIVATGYSGKKAYAIPRGGIPALYAVLASGVHMGIALTPEEADFFIDDIVDSGATMGRYCDKYPGKPFFALIDKTDKLSVWKDSWVILPWERQDRSEDDSIVGTITNRITEAGKSYFANDNISEFIETDELPLLQAELESRVEHMLEGLVIDIQNDHNTKGTAHRVAKMYMQEVFKGRFLPAPKITDFPNAKQLDEIYTVGPITIRSACSHHFVPILGRCWIGIIPGDRVIGISKFHRIVDWIASRPQIQEEFAMQVADFIEAAIQPKGLAVVIEATHMCMTWRGVKEGHTEMRNSIMRGAFRDKPEARAEFLALIK